MNNRKQKKISSAFLKDRHACWMRWFENEIEARYEAIGGGLEIIADVLQIGFEDPKCFGCAFINIVTEGGDFDNEPFAIAREQKDHLRRFVSTWPQKGVSEIQIWPHLRLFLKSSKQSCAL
jgi:hypothetical protein